MSKPGEALPAIDEKDNKFVPVHRDETRALLQSAIPTKARLQVWTPGNRASLQTRIVRVTESAPYTLISLARDEAGSAFETAIQKLGEETCLFSLHLPTDIVFFRADVRRGDAAYLNFRVNEPLYQLQRRRALRLPVPESEAPEVVVQLAAADAYPIRGRLMNISDGGVAVMLTEESDFLRLPNGKKVERLEFKLKNLEIRCAGQVRHSVEIGKSKLNRRFKIGLQFAGLPQETVDRVSRFVFEESARYAGRL